MYRSALVLLCSSLLAGAAVTSCPAGLPVGSVELRVTSDPAKPPLSLRVINRIQEGDIISYAPVLRQNERRHGEVTVVIVPATKEEQHEHPFVILDPKPAEKPAQWKIPFRVSLAAYVYGPSGLSTRKVKGFLKKDDELISELAEYAEKTEKTESLLQALSATSDTTTSEDVGAALQGFAGQYGLNNKIDRTAPMDQQTLALFRNLNPALSSYDPVSQQGSQGVVQTAGLATNIAGMFFGSTVGLAAGGTALVMNLESLMFPGAEFRSSFVQPASGEALTVCGKRDAPHGRTRLAYLWALRIPDSGPPHVAITGPNHLPLGLKSKVKIEVPGTEWPLVDRVRDWKLGNVPITVKTDSQNKVLELDLSKAQLNAARYELAGSWDWDPFTTKGEIYLEPVGTLEHARLTPESHDSLVQHSGKRIVHLEGADFEFVQKLALAKIGDKYDPPVDVPFSLPSGPYQGTQERLEMRVDTAPLDAGSYSLLVVQADGKTYPVPVDVVPEPPKIDHLPIALSTDQAKQKVTIRGQHLDRIDKLDGGPVKLALGPVSSDGTERTVTAELPPDPKQGATLDLAIMAHEYAKPLVLPGALLFAGPRTRITDADIALPSDLQVSLQPHELPAGIVLSAMVHVKNSSPNASMRLACDSGDASAVAVRVGEQNAAVKLQSIGADTLFLSFDPGTWPAGCSVEATLQTPGEEASPAYPLGRVVRVPRIDSLRLTDETASSGNYYGILTGSNLEAISKAGWDAQHGIDVTGLPTAIAGQPDKQSLKIALPWPSPAPHSPVYIWLRGDTTGRATTVRY